MDNYSVRQWLRAVTRRFGFDIVRYPTPRDIAGHTQLLLKELRIDHVLDVGANVGQYGKFLRSIGYGGKIISFEPVKSVHDDLVKASRDDTNWTSRNFALGSLAHTTEINVARSSVFSSIHTPLSSYEGNASDVTGRQSIEIHRLDSILADVVDLTSHPSIFLKLDTQGWDLEVLKGSSECIQKIQAIQTEVSVVPLYQGMPSWVDSISTLASLGFEPTGLFPVHYLGSFRSMEFDLIAVRPDAARSNTGIHQPLGRP